MTKHLLFAATALILTPGVTSAQNQPSQDKTDAPAALQSTTRSVAHGTAHRHAEMGATGFWRFRPSGATILHL
jgi:hypothetical protein